MSSDYPDYSPQGQKQVDWKKRILDLQDLQDWQGLRDWRRQWTKKEGRQGIQTNRVEVALTEKLQQDRGGNAGMKQAVEYRN